MKYLKNTPFNVPPSICILEGTPEWPEAYKAWLSGKNPTGSPEWKLGVFLGIVGPDTAIIVTHTDCN